MAGSRENRQITEERERKREGEKEREKENREKQEKPNGANDAEAGLIPPRGLVCLRYRPCWLLLWLFVGFSRLGEREKLACFVSFVLYFFAGQWPANHRYIQFS